MEASGANNYSSTVCSSMTRSSHWIFRKSSQPAVKDIFAGIFQINPINHVILQRHIGSMVRVAQ